jgi:hypothetical protein
MTERKRERTRERGGERHGERGEAAAAGDDGESSWRRRDVVLVVEGDAD